MKQHLAIGTKDHDLSYRRIAEKLMNDYKLQVRNKFYRIVECEFYYYHEEHHKDPFVHGHQRQKESLGEWYFHGSGLDITLSDGIAYGGILIRAISLVDKENTKPTKENTIIGPLNVCTEIFKQFGNALSTKPIEFGLVDISKDPMGALMKKAEVFAVPRIGLNRIKDEEGNYWDKPYRFISFLHLPHREADKVKKFLIENNKLTPEVYKMYYKGERI
jgi:hypothetical protein